MAHQRLTVAVRSPDTIVTAGVVGLLERHPQVFRVVPPPGPAVEADPDVVVYDLFALAHGDVGELCHLVGRTHARVLAVARDLRPDLEARARAVGVDAVVSLSASEADLVAGVRAAVREPADVLDEASSGPADRPGGQHLGAAAGLTPRESAVIASVAAGLSNQEIAEAMYLSINSVKTYIRNAYRKLGVASRAQAVAWAILHGFPAQPPDDGRP